ncbi:MAG TPA: tetratricopeptide repeat protein [Puia sp.]|jgi:tetratricopeptide (TPR) repeat protein
MSFLDHSLTRVLLIGASEFPRDSTIHAIPNVAANLRLLKACLTDPDLVGIPESNITISLNENRSIIERRLRQLAAETRTKNYTIFIYYAGHGMLSSTEYKLYLTTADTSHDDLEIDGINIDAFKNYIRRSNAGRKVILLDCCHSGAIIETMSGLASRIQAGLRGFEGTYVMTSAASDEPSMFPGGNPELPTYFTGKFINIVRSGLEDASEYCSLREIFNEIERDFADRFPPLPRPQQSNFLHADQLFFCKNKLSPLYKEPGEAALPSVSFPAGSPPAQGARNHIIAIVLLIAVTITIILIRIIGNIHTDPLPSSPVTSSNPAGRDTTAVIGDTGKVLPSSSSHTAATTPVDPDPDHNDTYYYNKASDDFNASRYRSAVANATKAIQLNPKDADSYKVRGWSRFYLKLYEDAIDDLSAAIRLKTKDAAAYKYRAMSEQALKAYTEAIGDFSTAIRMDNTDFFTVASRGDCYTSLRQYNNAINDYTQAIALTTKQPWVFFNRANAWYLTGNYQNAIADYTRAINLDPKPPIYWNYRGDASRKAGKLSYCSDYEQAAQLGDSEGQQNLKKYCNQ